MTRSARRTPVLGWNSWNAFRCGVDEASVLANADALVASGLREAGYRMVMVDDCWQAPRRARPCSRCRVGEACR